ncbi:MAG: GTPase domain-containing protein [Rubrivivax sp.]|nr:GTPase domain-containing protein [Rubrivivax sp.]
MTTVTLSLVSHTNVGKTTLARTLLGRDVGEVRDAPHVTEFADEHLLIESPEGHRLMLWDTPGFGDSVRLARRMRQSAQPLGWLLGQVWDRWRDRAFWMSQQALRHVREGSDVLLYLVNASEPEAGYLASEMQLLAWTGRPVVVLLNQLGPPRAQADEQREQGAWRERLAPWPMVQAVLPLDAFARCWVHEAVLLHAVRRALADDAPRAAAMQAVASAWQARREAQFDAAMAELAAVLARVAAARETVPEPAGLSERLRDFGARLLGPEAQDPVEAARARLAGTLESQVRASTGRLLALHGIAAARRAPVPVAAGADAAAAAAAATADATAAAAATATGLAPVPAPDDPVAQVIARVAAQVQQHRRVPEGRSAVLGGAITGALAGLKADVATGGLTLGGGLIAGGILGALGAAGLARGINLVRGTGRSWVAWDAAAMPALTEAALLRYLAVAHYGRGRGEWAEAEAPPHWPAAVATALAPRAEALARLWQSRAPREDEPAAAARLAAALQPLLAATARDVLVALYPALGPDSDNPRA